MPMMAPIPSAVRFTGTERPFEAVVARGFGLKCGDALTSEQIHQALAGRGSWLTF